MGFKWNLFGMSFAPFFLRTDQKKQIHHLAVVSFLWPSIRCGPNISFRHALLHRFSVNLQSERLKQTNRLQKKNFCPCPLIGSHLAHHLQKTVFPLCPNLSIPFCPNPMDWPRLDLHRTDGGACKALDSRRNGGGEKSMKRNRLSVSKSMQPIRARQINLWGKKGHGKDG